MASLTGQKIKDTYDGLLKTTDSTQGLPETGITRIQDGLGNPSSLSLGREEEGAEITGDFSVTGNTPFAKLPEGLPLSGRVPIQDGFGNDSTLSIGSASGYNGADIHGNLTVDTVFAYQLKSDGAEVGLKLESDSLLGTKIRIANSNETYDAVISSRGGNVNIGRVDGVSTNNLNIKKENGYVGIKQKAPLAPLHIKRNGEAIRLESFGDNECSIDFRQGSAKRASIEYDKTGDSLNIESAPPTGTRSQIKFKVASQTGGTAEEFMRIQGAAGEFDYKQVVIGGLEYTNSSKELLVNGGILATEKCVLEDDVSIGGRCDADSFKLKGLNDAPATATSPGVIGEIRYTADYIYVCVQNGVWKRTALTSW
jgi:hypothetical protein